MWGSEDRNVGRGGPKCGAQRTEMWGSEAEMWGSEDRNEGVGGSKCGAYGRLALLPSTEKGRDVYTQ